MFAHALVGGMGTIKDARPLVSPRSAPKKVLNGGLPRVWARQSGAFDAFDPGQLAWRVNEFF
jgi:hypothetical protein